MSQTSTTMANSKSAKIIEIPEVEEDVEFLYQLEAAEARALSLSSPPSSKRRRLSVEETNNNNNNNNNYSNDVTVEEGAYTAALKGSKSLTWQKQVQQQQQQNFAVKNASDSPRIGGGGGGGGGGGCFKCGKEGHWARECPQVTSSAAVVGSTLTTAAAVEKACACGLGNCLLLTANTERNRGRKFFRCPVRQENGGCGFFEWCDETPGNRTSAEGDRAWMNGGQQQSYQRPSNQAASTFTKSWNNFDKETSAPNSTYVQNFETNENKGYSMRSDSSCFKCGEQGHWAKDCLTTSSNATAGVRTSSNVTAGVKGTPSSGACFKCGQSGHWARDCTQGQSTMVRNW